jgi:hypothetical protein
MQPKTLNTIKETGMGCFIVGLGVEILWFVGSSLVPTGVSVTVAVLGGVFLFVAICLFMAYLVILALGKVQPPTIGDSTTKPPKVSYKLEIALGVLFLVLGAVVFFFMQGLA